MFEFEEKLEWFYIFTDKIKWKFWPFRWIFIKNKYHWNINDYEIDEWKYPWYKYSFWFWNNSIFIISLDWTVELIKI